MSATPILSLENFRDPTTGSINRVIEGNSGSKQISFVVKLSSPSSSVVKVNFLTQDIYAIDTGKVGAKSGEDYLASSGTLTFAPGETIKTFSVSILGDTNYERTETFGVGLRSASGAIFPGNQSQTSLAFSIVDDDIASLPILSLENFQDPTTGSINRVVEGDSGSRQITFVVKLSSPSSSAVTVNYLTQDIYAIDTGRVGAESGADYIASSGTLTFAPGETIKSFSVSILGDTSYEGTETFGVGLRSASGAIFPGNQSQTSLAFSIVDDDSAPTPTYTLTPSDITINEGSTLATAVATTNVASGTTLYYSLTGTGITSADFSAGALTGSGTVGTDGKFSISYTIANDLTTEGSEYIEIKLFTDSSRSTQVGSTASVSIADTSTTPTNNGNGTPNAITGSGAFREGVTLTAPLVTGDPDGMPTNPNYKYQWYKGGNIVVGATASTYAVPASGAGTYKVAVTYTDAQEFTATVDSTDQVISVFNNGNGTPGAITGSGAFREGVTLTAPVVTGDPDGITTNPNYKYQWYKGGNIVVGATASTYAVPASGAGTYKVAVAYTDAQEFTATVDSTDQVISVFNNGNGTPGAITGSGAFREGVTLTAPVVTGDPDGMPTIPNYKYQWFRNNSAISLATGKTYKVPTTGSGTYRVAVTYTDAQDFTATVNSANQAVAKINNGNGTPGAITGSGAFREGVTLTAPVVTGDPDGMATIPNYKYQWFKNNSAISLATGKTYKVPTTGSGTYRVAVTFTDAQDFTAMVNSANQFIAKVLTGTASANSLVGTVGDDLITGLGGADRLTGSAGADTFRYAALSDSILAAYDRITDFAIGTDIFDAPRAVSSTNIKQLGRVTVLTQEDIEKVLGKSNSSLGKQVFASHRAATFTVGLGGSTRTFLGINDATAGFDQRFDALVEITGYSGSLANLAIV